MSSNHRLYCSGRVFASYSQGLGFNPLASHTQIESRSCSVHKAGCLSWSSEHTGILKKWAGMPVKEWTWQGEAGRERKLWSPSLVLSRRCGPDQRCIFLPHHRIEGLCLPTLKVWVRSGFTYFKLRKKKFLTGVPSIFAFRLIPDAVKLTTKNSCYRPTEHLAIWKREFKM